MKYIINDLYREAQNEMDKIKKSKLSISERVALEIAITKLDAIKKLLNSSEITLN